MVPNRPWEIPACAGSDDSGEVRKSIPRVWKTGHARVSTLSRRMASTASENRRLASRSSWKIMPRTSGRVDVRPRRTAAPVAAGAIRLIEASLVPLPRPTDERVADDVEQERDHEQHRADEEQARERQVVAAHPVAPDRERSHRGGERLTDVEDVP